MPSTHHGMLPSQRFEPMLVDDKKLPTLLPPLIFEENWHSRPSSFLSSTLSGGNKPSSPLFTTSFGGNKPSSLLSAAPSGGNKPSPISTASSGGNKPSPISTTSYGGNKPSSPLSATSGRNTPSPLSAAPSDRNKPSSPLSATSGRITPSPLSAAPSGRNKPSRQQLVYPRRPVLPATPPSSPRFAALQPLNTQKMRDVCTFVPLALDERESFSSDRSQSGTPGLSDSFSASSDDDDQYHASTTSLWDSYHANAPQGQLHNLPFVRSCHDLSVRYISHAPPPLPTSVFSTAPVTPVTPVTPTTPRKAPRRAPPLRHQASFPNHRTAPPPDVFKALPPTPPRTFSMYNTLPAAAAAPHTRPPMPPMPIVLPHPRTASPHPRTAAPRPFSPAAAPPRTASPLPRPFTPATAPSRTASPLPRPFSPAAAPSRTASPLPRPSLPPARLALFPASETPPRPSMAVSVSEAPVEKSVWEEDDEEGLGGGLGKVARKLHIRSLSAGNSSAGGGKGGKEKEGGREKERERGGRRSAGEVVRGIFGRR